MAKSELLIQDELDNMPINGGITNIKIPLPDKRYPDAQGEFINIPKMEKTCVMALAKDDYAIIVDRSGKAWSTGTINGIKYKQRAII